MQYLGYLIDPSFRGVNRLFILSFEVMIDGETSQSTHIYIYIYIYIKIQQIATGSGDDQATGYLLHYPYFKEKYYLIAVDLSKQEAPDPKTIEQINFPGNLD